MNKFALLISGGVNSGYNYGRYLNDLVEIYKTLLDKYAYLKSNITVLYADGSNHDLDGDGNNDISNSAIKVNVVSALQTLKTQVTANDILFIFTTNHGGQSTTGTQDARLWLWQQQYIEDSEFATLLDAISFKVAIIVMEQCYSGGFIDNLQAPNRIICTACNWDEVSYACDSEGNFDEFVYHWTAAVRGKKPDGTPVDAAGPDGKVSIKEAFDYAKANDSWSVEHPQFYESTDELGDQYTLGGLVLPIVVPTCLSRYKEICIKEITVPPCTAPYYRVFCLRSKEITVPPCPAPLYRVRVGPCLSPYRVVPTCLTRQVIEGCRMEGPIRPGEEFIDPAIMTKLIDQMRLGYIQAINSLSNAGYGDEDIAMLLEQLAVEMEGSLNEIKDIVNEFRGKGSQHFRRMTR